MEKNIKFITQVQNNAQLLLNFLILSVISALRVGIYASIFIIGVKRMYFF